MERTATLGETMNMVPALSKLWNSEELEGSRRVFGLTDERTLASMVDDFLATTKKDDFIFHREYRVRATYTKVRGKW